MYNNFDYSHLWGFGIGTLFGFGIIMVAIFVAVLCLKGYALWTAAKRDDKPWFIILLIVNTFGILELIYLYFVANKFGANSENKSGEGNEKKPDSHEDNTPKNHESNNR